MQRLHGTVAQSDRRRDRHASHFSLLKALNMAPDIVRGPPALMHATCAACMLPRRWRVVIAAAAAPAPVAGVVSSQCIHGTCALIFHCFPESQQVLLLCVDRRCGCGNGNAFHRASPCGRITPPTHPDQLAYFAMLRKLVTSAFRRVSCSASSSLNAGAAAPAALAAARGFSAAAAARGVGESGVNWTAIGSLAAAGLASGMGESKRHTWDESRRWHGATA